MALPFLPEAPAEPKNKPAKKDDSDEETLGRKWFDCRQPT